MSDTEQTRRRPTSDNDDNDFTVEAIVDERKVGTRKEYCIKWEGFSSEENTWEPTANLKSCTLIVNTWKSSDRFKQLQREQRAKKKTPVKSDSGSTIVPYKRLGIERNSSLPGVSLKSRERSPERDGNAEKRFKDSKEILSQSLLSLVLDGLPATGRTTSSKSDSQVQRTAKTPKRPRQNSPTPTSSGGKSKPTATSKKGLDRPLLTSFSGKKQTSGEKKREAPSPPVEVKKVIETKDGETQTLDDPMTRIIPKELLPFEDEIERLRSRAEFAVSVKGRMLPKKRPENFEPDDALIMITFREDDAEEAAIFLQRVVKFVMPMLLVKFYKAYADITLSTDVDLETFR